MTQFVLEGFVFLKIQSLFDVQYMTIRLDENAGFEKPDIISVRIGERNIDFCAKTGNGGTRMTHSLSMVNSVNCYKLLDPAQFSSELMSQLDVQRKNIINCLVRNRSDEKLSNEAEQELQQTDAMIYQLRIGVLNYARWRTKS